MFCGGVRTPIQNIMSKEQTSIHEFDFNLICEYFAHLERQGPGSQEATLKALDFIDGLNERPEILDIGCGTGGQTMTLARHTQGNITGIDLFPRFIDIFNRNAKQLGLQNRVKGIVGSMDALPFGEESLDLIWSEGAIYNIGFERGITEWRRLLKKGGYLAVTEASWFTEQRPDEIHNFWMDAYPGIDTIPNTIARLQKAGYVPTAAFILPEHCWTDNFFRPQVPVQEEFLAVHRGNNAAEALVENMRREAELYERYKDFYGYVFYIGKKI